jgi:hypothetical protein
MVLQDLGRRINAAVSDLTRAPNLDEKAGSQRSVMPHVATSATFPSAGGRGRGAELLTLCHPHTGF